MYRKSEPFFAKGTFYFAKVQEPEYNKLSGRNEYSVCIVLDDKSILNKLEKLDSRIVKQFKQNKDGTTKFPDILGMKHIRPKTILEPIVLDAKKNPIPKDILIGNGSRGIAKMHWYEYKAGTGGVTLSLHGIQVLNLKEYTKGPSAEGFEESEGYVATQQGKKEESLDDDDWDINTEEEPW